MSRPTRPGGAAAAFLARPDAILPPDGAVRPLDLAVRTAVGLGGAAIFCGVLAAGIASAGPERAGRLGASLLRLAAVPPAAALLSFPPLVLMAALQGRETGLVRLAGVAAGGPAAAGIWMGAASPVLMLFVLTGSVDAAFGLLSLAIAGVSVLAGAIGAVRNARRAGDTAPGAFTVLGHYGLFGWTAFVLALHLV
jgi:hypothetical protein